MPFYPPSWAPPLPEVPDSISVETFIFDEKYGRRRVQDSRPPFVDGLSGKSYTVDEVKHRVDYLSRAMASELGFMPNEGTEWDKAVACFSLNTIDYLTLAWAVHRLGGVLICCSASGSAGELQHQLKDTGAKAIFTCLPLLKTALASIKAINMPPQQVYLLELTPRLTKGMTSTDPGHKTVQQLIDAGTRLPSMKAADAYWRKGDGKKRIAFVCYSSGTSGLPKGIMIAHQNIIANVMQHVIFEEHNVDAGKHQTSMASPTFAVLGLLPLSHCYGLIATAHIESWRGNSVVVLPRYNFEELLGATERFRIDKLHLVPPIVIDIAKQSDLVMKHDLSSIKTILSGAAPLTEETERDLAAVLPGVSVLQGYGLSEVCAIATSVHASDPLPGSAGSLHPGFVMRIFTPDGEEEITEQNRRGELWFHSPSLVAGYLNNDKANEETFITREDDGLRYVKTGDEGMVVKSAKGHEHIFITDRIKELIKVKGNQVAPAELEGHLLSHPAVSDCVVIGVPSEREGEVPKAFIVRAPAFAAESEEAVMQSIMDYVARHKSDYKRLRGGVEFVDVVPKSPSGKILRRLVRDQERAKLKQRMKL